MSREPECPICLSAFVRPHILNCGHTLCLTCIQSLRAHSPSNACCPECRRIISTLTPNYALNGGVGGGSDAADDDGGAEDTMKVVKNRKFVLHDNSGSMKYNQDASVLEIDNNGTIRSHGGKYRYEEANQRTRMIVQQTIEDEEEVTIYLLNPVSEGVGYEYEEDVDFVTINKDNFKEKKDILEQLLHPNHIHGTTPTATIIRRITTDIRKCMNKKNGGRRFNGKWTVICNTDGEPDNDAEFENALKELVRFVPCILIFNIITDAQHIVEYYNDLDVNLNKGLEEMTPVVDVLDDLLSEAKEVHRANPWLVYSYAIHKKRISGTDHIVYDLMDEETLSLFYANILIKLILKRDDIPEIDSPEYFPFLEVVAKENMVYDILSGTFKPFVNVNALKWEYYYGNIVKQLQANYTVLIGIWVVFIMLLIPLCL